MKEKMRRSGVAGGIGLLIGGLFFSGCSDSERVPLSSGEPAPLALSSAPADTGHNHAGAINSAAHLSADEGTGDTAYVAQMMEAVMEQFHGVQDTMHTGAATDTMMDSGHSMMGGH